jgi:hypothetical protein
MRLMPTELLVLHRFSLQPWSDAAQSLCLISVVTSQSQKVLNCLARCFGCYSMSDPAAESLADEITAAEGVLAERRNTLKLGYTPPAGSTIMTFWHYNDIDCIIL